eukprot:scaffold196168_cov38-Tisochrysis_lutea.AAC.4
MAGYQSPISTHHDRERRLTLHKPSRRSASPTPALSPSCRKAAWVRPSAIGNIQMRPPDQKNAAG